MLLDIVILPPKGVSDRIGKLTGHINKEVPLKWRVDNKKLLPHISLFHIQIKTKDLAGITKKIEQLVKKQKAIKLYFLFPEIPFHGEKIFFGLGIKSETKLSKFHKNVVIHLLPFRNGQMPVVFPYTNRDDLVYSKRYGAPAVLDRFSPHITLGMVKTSKNIVRIKNLVNQEKFKNFLGSTVAITKVNPYWQVTKILKKFKLKK